MTAAPSPPAATAGRDPVAPLIDPSTGGRHQVDPAVDVRQVIAELPPELRRLEGRPFGRDETGAAIAHGSGQIIAGAVRYLQAVVGDRAERGLETGVDITERATFVAAEREAVLGRLVAMVNAAVPDDRYHVTGEYLLNPSNNYSYEFRLFVAEYCRILSGDADFFYNQGRRSIPGSIVLLARPIGVRQTYAVLPRFTAKYVRTDLRVLDTSRDSATIRWYGSSQLVQVPPALHRRYLAYACAAYRGTFAAIPAVLAGLPPAKVRQGACQLDGADHCEWSFEWEAGASSRSLPAVVAGVGGSLAMLAWLVLRLPAWEAVGTVAATLLPASLVLYGGHARRRAAELRRQQQLLLEQRDLSEREYDRSERANADLQLSNLELEHRVAELMTLNEVAVTASTTLDLDDLLDRSLEAVVRHLRFDRALVLVADEQRGVLTNGRSVGSTEEMQRLVAGLELPLDHPRSQLAALYRADGPMLFQDVDQDPDEANRQLASALGVTSFLGTPLVTQGRPMGVLAVDNRLSGREVEPGDGPLLFTVGNLIAGAIENARLYSEIERQNRDLEERVAQRTKQLRRAIDEAQRARATAEAASETKSSFLANVSHELRTPLTSVVGFTKLVRKRLDDVLFPMVATGDPKVDRALRQVRENLEIMAAEGERLTTMINDVLDLAKIEAGKLEWRTEAVDIGGVVQRAAAATSALFESTGLELVLDIEPDLPVITGDRDRLMQVVINLLSNAVKFTPSGAVTVRARRDGDAIVVAVADTGVGIAPDDHATVFEQFRQAGDTLTDKPRGTGLGLPISRQIVEHHGGRMWLTSERGSGSTFWFSLPLAAVASESAVATDDPGDTADRATTADELEDRARGRSSAATVVLVEDDAATRELVRQAVEPAGLRLLDAANGEDGLALIEQRRPDLVVLDVVLPGIDGFELLERLRSHPDPGLANLPVVLLTVIDDRERAERLRVGRHLVKPFDADALAVAIGELLPGPVG